MQAEHKYPVPLKDAKASFERIEQRLRHLRMLAGVKHLPNDYTLVSDLDRQFGDLPVGSRKILLSMIHGFGIPARGHLVLADPSLHANDLLSARSLTLEI